VALDDLREMIGRRGAGGITDVGADGGVVTRDPFVGAVQEVEPLAATDRSADEAFTPPPGPASFDRAQPGGYRLRSTGETMVDPEYVSTWTAQAPSA
jgi:hypothetical protein